MSDLSFACGRLLSGSTNNICCLKKPRLKKKRKKSATHSLQSLNTAIMDVCINMELIVIFNSLLICADTTVLLWFTANACIVLFSEKKLKSSW